MQEERASEKEWWDETPRPLYVPEATLDPYYTMVDRFIIITT